jgi:hypothetical protein
LVLGIALSLPSVQTKIAQYFTEKINKQYETNINIEQATVTIYGGVKLKKVSILDHRKKILIFANRINTNVLDTKKLLDGDLLFGDLRIDGFLLNLKNYKGEKDSNLDKFIASFDTGKKSSKPFLMKANKIYLTNSRFMLTDENRVAPKDLDLKKLNSELKNFQILGPNVNCDIKKMSFLDHRGLFVENLSSTFTYTKKNIKLEKLDLLTKESIFKGDVLLNYERKDFSDFNNKVQFDIKIDTASLATNDIRHFYNELAKNQHFFLKSKIKGTLNDLNLTKLNLKDSKNTQIIGDVNFKNLFGKGEQPFYMKGNFSKVSSNYENLTTLLPNVLGKKLPSSLKKLGQFNLNGKSEITAKTIDADFYMTTALGNIKSDLILTNIDNIDNATYKGNVVLENFNLGSFLNRKDIEKVSIDVDVNGKGFTQKYLKTSFEGNIFKIKYNGYEYKNVVVNGVFVKPIFKGQVTVNDPNLLMDFNGTVDLSKKSNHYNFDTKIGFANLKKLNFMKDSISNFKGDIKMNVSGSNIDNLIGNVYITNTSYQNKKDTYHFDDFQFQSSFDANNVRTITVNSPDIIDGKVVGKFQFNLLQKMLENSIGSLYTNYRPNKIQKGQFLKFDFNIYNKIIEIFYPGITIAKNTFISGNMSSDNDEFKFNFKSPQITAFNNYLDNINVEIDNKNPLYNTYVELDSIRTKNYKVSNFSLINVTVNDTLFLRSEFKGGKKAEDVYNLNLYHTINKDNKNVVGIKKSEVKFKDNLWFLNENENDQNKVVFDKGLKDFSIENIIMSHENEKISLLGNFQNTRNKDLKLDFTEVDLHKVLPSLDKFKIDGLLNGPINIKQKDNIYQPTASLQIDNLKVNDNALGKLLLDISGDEKFSKFNINSSIENENLEAFNAKGTLTMVDKQTNLDLDLNFDKFNLGILSSIGGTTISNIKGFASGKARIDGNISDLDINGRLFIDDAGLKIPYLNTEYGFQNGTIVDVSKTKFIFKNVSLEDTKYKTQGKLNGFIQHKNFGDWRLDLNIDSKNIIALDTEDSEDAAYYGKAFISGDASIFGATNALTINVNAKSNKGTDIKIPVNDSESIGSNNYIHFISPKEKENINKGVVETRTYEGLELNFDLDITRDADIEIILNRESKHGMKGKGLGTLNLAINTLGKFNMVGDFFILSGKYNFKYGGLIDKTFDVKKGGTVVWSGDPMRADLNLEATYKTSANPGVLLENSSISQKVPVVVTIGVKGNLSNPIPDFDIDFPTVSSVLKSEIQTKLDDKDVRQKQALVLLGSGSFLSPEGINQSALVTSNLFEKASSLFDDLFQDPDSKIKFDVAYNQAEKTIAGKTNGTFDLNISSQINDRISVNGKLGVPVGGVNESAIVGNLEIKYRVNEDGTMNLRVFNRENEINYIGEGIGYTQGLGISYEVDFDTFNELVNKIFKKKTIDIEKKSNNDQEPDSTTKPDFINFPDDKKKPKSDEPKKNKDTVPVDGN